MGIFFACAVNKLGRSAFAYTDVPGGTAHGEGRNRTAHLLWEMPGFLVGAISPPWGCRASGFLSDCGVDRSKVLLTHREPSAWSCLFSQKQATFLWFFRLCKQHLTTQGSDWNPENYSSGSSRRLLEVCVCALPAPEFFCPRNTGLPEGYHVT